MQPLGQCYPMIWNREVEVRVGDGRVSVGNDSRESMSGDVFLSELFVRALSRVSATEQIVYPCVGSYGFGIFGAT